MPDFPVGGVLLTSAATMATSVPGRLEVLHSVAMYFADHPTHQNTSLDVTGPSLLAVP